jgi:mycofactocin system glycosyltransferase
MPDIPDSNLPSGFTVRLNRRVKITDKGRVLIGGSPTRVLYLSETASKTLSDRTILVSNPTTRLLADRLLEAGMADPVIDGIPDLDQDLVTVVIPVYGRFQALDRVLESLGTGYRVIVVDDCSPDPSAVRRVAEKYQVELVRLETNGGPARARNAGLRRVRTPFVAFADSDIVVDPRAIPNLLKHFVDPRVGLAGPRVEGLDELTGMNWIGRYEEARSSLDLGIYPAVVRPRSPVSWLPGAFLVARVDALEGGFTPDKRVGEDVDLVWRLVERGWRVRFDPAARVWLGGPSESHRPRSFCPLVRCRSRRALGAARVVRSCGRRNLIGCGMAHNQKAHQE